MRVLLDGNMPRQLVPLLAAEGAHVVHTVHQRRWSDLPDRALLDAAAGEYEAFVTLDRNLPQQQNLAARPFAVIVVRARTNRIQDLQPLVPALTALLATARPGDVRVLGV